MLADGSMFSLVLAKEPVLSISLVNNVLTELYPDLASEIIKAIPTKGNSGELINGNGGNENYNWTVTGIWGFYIEVDIVSKLTAIILTPLPELVWSEYAESFSSMPIGLDIIHSPNPVKAQEGGPSGRKFSWVYKTTVRAVDDTVTIINFGAYTLSGNKWVFSNYNGNPFSASDFADWYSCPKATLASGQEFYDVSNWSGSDSLNGVEIKWVYVGINSKGEYVKGESTIETIGEVGK
jgi:hypothetical protein